MPGSPQSSTAPTGEGGARVDEACGVGRLPLPVTSFVGRAREVTDLSGRLWAPGGARLVTLTGPSGIGKSRLAVEVARRVAPRYPAGVWLVELAPVVDPDLVARTVADALHLQPQPGRSPLELLIDHVRSHQLLLVLDNCEHLVAACSELASALLSAADLSILATSQRLLEVTGERAVAVAPMSLPDPSTQVAEEALRSEAVRLFCMRAEATTAAFRLTDDAAPHVAEICLSLDGIPLAIELAAARTNVLAPVEIAERLENRLRLLNRGAGGAPVRHQTLRASLDWSYDLLSPAEAALLRRLAVFAGGAPLLAVEEVCSGGDVARADVVDHLSELVARSLVVPDISGHRSRFGLLGTVREYGRERMAAAGELGDQLRRHAEWCLTVCDEADAPGMPGESVEEVLGPELDNVTAALSWSQEHDPVLGMRLATGMWSYWKVRGLELREGRAWLERALRADPGVPADLRIRALQRLGMLALVQGDVPTATAALEESLTAARSAGLQSMEALSLSLLGFVSIFTQDPLAGLPLLEQSVVLHRATGEVRPLINALALYGRAQLYLGETDSATRVFEECLELARGEHGEDEDVGLLGMAWSAFIAGQQRTAHDLFVRTLELVRIRGDRYDEAIILSFLGELAWARGDLAEARSRLDEGLVLARKMGAPFPMAKCLSTLARIAAGEGAHAEAHALADEAFTLARSSCLPYAAVRCLLARSGVRLAIGDLDGAQDDADEALTTAQSTGDESGVAAATAKLARVAKASGNQERAASLASEALAIQVRLPDAAGLASGLELLAGMLVEGDRLASAARLFGAAEAIRNESGSPCPPDELAAYQEDVAKVIAAADPELDEAWRAGAALSQCEAVLLASRGRGRRGRPTQGWASLTPAERQVAELAVLGLTNNEIGEKLFVSPRTVQGHLLRIFPKLGVLSRRQLRGMKPD